MPREIAAETAMRLARVAAARSRRRSDFIRTAIPTVLWALEERQTAAAYRRQPDPAADAHVDPAVWEAGEKPSRRKKRRQRPRRATRRAS